MGAGIIRRAAPAAFVAVWWTVAAAAQPPATGLVEDTADVEGNVDIDTMLDMDL